MAQHVSHACSADDLQPPVALRGASIMALQHSGGISAQVGSLPRDVGMHHLNYLIISLRINCRAAASSKV
jgi:hypothetical protein